MNDIEFFRNQFDVYFNRDRMIYTYPPYIEEWIIDVPNKFLWDISASYDYKEIIDNIYKYIEHKAEDAFEEYDVTNFTNARTMNSAVRIIGKRKQA